MRSPFIAAGAIAALMALSGADYGATGSYSARRGSHLPAPGKPKAKRKFKGSKAAKRQSRKPQ